MMSDPNIPDLASKVTEATRQVGDTQVALNLMWVVLCGAIVMFIQCGFAMVETGLTRAKNVTHTMAMNFFVYPIGILGFWMTGFALQMGGVGALPALGDKGTLGGEFAISLAGKPFGLFGTTGFFLGESVYTPAVAAIFLFQMVFMDTAATIPTGVMAERWKFTSFVLMSFFISMFIYPVYANWVWGGGWLGSLGKNFGLGHGHVDFAGSSVVHVTGAVVGYVGGKLIGPRIGKYDAEGRPKPIPGHNIPYQVIGTFIMAFGWFAFNAGSTLSGMDVRFSVVATNTMLASAAGSFTSYLYVALRYGKPDVTMLCNGTQASLVAITAPCAFVSSSAAIFIGAVAGILVVFASIFIETEAKIDDPVGAIAVHGVCGSWGCLALGLFANGKYGDGYNGVAGNVTGLFYGAPKQLVAECVGLLANVAFVAPAAYVGFLVIDRLVGNRSNADDEIQGLSMGEIGIEGYSTEAPEETNEAAGMF
jgi:Amt family ammonium transporter